MANTLRKGTYTETESGNPAEVWHDEQGRWHNPDGPAYIERDPETGLVEARRYIHGELHCETGPAITLTNAAGVVLEEDYFQHDLHHREDGPARIRRWADGRLETEMWFLDGLMDRGDDLPALIHHGDNGVRLEEGWYRRDEQQREGDKPSLVRRDNNSQVIEQIWTQDGVPHRDGKPSRIGYDRQTGWHFEEWHQNGALDRPDGPAAFQMMDKIPGKPELGPNPKPHTMDWWKDGEPITPTAHQQMKWQIAQTRQGGVLWKEPAPAPEQQGPRPGGVKAAAALAKAIAEVKGTKPKATDRGDER